MEKTNNSHSLEHLRDRFDNLINVFKHNEDKLLLDFIDYIKQYGPIKLYDDLHKVNPGIRVKLIYYSYHKQGVRAIENKVNMVVTSMEYIDDRIYVVGYLRDTKEPHKTDVFRMSYLLKVMYYYFGMKDNSNDDIVKISYNKIIKL